jgi:leukotriene-A4 hydrolase
MNKKYVCYILLMGISILSCREKMKNAAVLFEDDPHSFSRPDISSVKHLDLDLKIDFEKKSIEGTACYELHPGYGDELILDNIGLKIHKVEIHDGSQTATVDFKLLKTDSILGTAIRIPLKPNIKSVCIYYATGSDAIALQWLPKEQTLSKSFPFLFTQSQSIYARTWIPCPDGPGMRFSYNARVQVPPGMMVVMSASNVQEKNSDGRYTFKMDIPIPAYLLALACGDFSFRPIGERTGVYAEPGLLDNAAYEFADLEKMLVAAENLYGAYPWHRYDVIVLPASFPYGGMENPQMTFLTPSVIAGDQSLTSLLAHELAHSWSGNLVTNASWNDFWLNEGFTTYFESRIMEALYGKPYADMLSVLGLQDLEKTIHEFGDSSPMTKLKLDLKNQNPEEALSDVAYEKGKALLMFLEERMGRDRLDPFLKKYFQHFKFRSNTSEGFLEFFKNQNPELDKSLLDTIQHWIYNPGHIPFRPNYNLENFHKIDKQLTQFLLSNDIKDLQTEKWSTHEWLYFIRSLPKDKNKNRCETLEKHFKLSLKNSEIKCLWFEYCIQNEFGEAMLAQISEFLHKTGRRKFLMPVYKALKTNNLATNAKTIFESAKHSYHPIALESVNNLLLDR